jgi:hypothetical protein
MVVLIITNTADYTMCRVTMCALPRLSARTYYLKQREELHDAVRALPPGDPHTVVVTYDDTWRFLSWLFGFIHCIDKIEVVAKTALQQECQQRDGWLAWAK